MVCGMDFNLGNVLRVVRRPRRSVTGSDESSVSDEFSGTVGDQIGPLAPGIDDCGLDLTTFSSWGLVPRSDLQDGVVQVRVWTLVL